MTTLNVSPRYGQLVEQGVNPGAAYMAAVMDEMQQYMGEQGAVLIVTGGHLQEPALRAVRKLGLQAIVTDADPNCHCAALADKFCPLDIFDVEGHVKLVRELQAGDVNLRAVFTAASEATLTVANAAREAGLHHTHPQIVATCRSKSITRQALQDYAVPQPKWRVVFTPEEAQVAVATLGPSIVKATGGMGGKGHTKIAGPEDVTENVFGKAMHFSLGKMVLVEELLDGLELSAETLWWNGTMVPLNAVERPFAHRPQDLARYAKKVFEDEDCFYSYTGIPHLSVAGFFDMGDFKEYNEIARRYTIELGHYNPALLEPAQWDEIWAVMQLAGEAVGLADASGGHILKGDLILTADGVKVLELTPRLSGNFDSGRTSPLAHGVDYTLGALKLALGEGPDWSLFMPQWHRHAACLFKFAPEGTVKSVTMPTDALRLPAEVIIRYGVGDRVPPLDSYAALAAWVVADGATRTEAVGRAYRVLAGLEYETE